MTRILIVAPSRDSRDSVLAGLVAERPFWEVVTAGTMADAFEEVASGPFDAVVASSALGPENTVAFLEDVRRQDPSAIRLVASSAAEASGYETVMVAHQVLTAPLQPERLVEAVDLACRVRDRLDAPHLREVLGSIGSLPSPPSSVIALNALLVRPDARVDDIVSIVAADVGMSAKVLQLVNSAFFGLSKQVTGLRQAVAFLGLTNVRNLVLTVEAFGAFDRATFAVAGVLEQVQSHAVATAETVGELVNGIVPRGDSGTYGLAAMLHDIGLLVMAASFPDQLLQVLDASQAESDLATRERQVFGATHPDVGATLLALWGLPTPMVQAVALHHDAAELPIVRLSPLHAVYVAERLLEEQNGLPEPGVCSLDPDYVEALGLTASVTRWRAAAGLEVIGAR